METKKTKRDTKGPKEHKPSWQETYASIDEIMAFLDNHVLLRHNVVMARVEYRIPTTYYNKTPTEWQPNEHETGEFMPVARAMQIIGGNTTQKLSAVMIGRAFMELGYECRRTNHSRGYLVVQRSGLEIKERMKDMAVTGDG